ncbi:MAG: hypothetical protein KKG47_07705 [Proteobacteria bacterium]|nr:hypothetical protein [Pseudomonadota bacterium]MBU1738401.1 hypothetical protein [Pseudomonadota bacterium]
MNKTKEFTPAPPSEKRIKIIGLLYFVTTIILWLVYADGQLALTLRFLKEVLGT